ncbi:MAG TPA: beta-ketoacyl-ACP synthase II [Candidatus Kapabacteria bacterium]|nr:beta-ketoacyl-ACP synthase II [Candidatus Kapabacteria bacterium]
MPHNNRRVVVTGMGALTPIGNSLSEYWDGLSTGRSGAATITRFDASDYDTKFACEVKNFDPNNYMDRKSANRMDMFTQFGVAASEMALKDSGIDLTKTDLNRFGVVYGSGIGGMWTYQKQQETMFETGGPHRISPFFVPMLISDICAGLISMRNGLKGPNYATTSACATSNNAIADAVMLIQRGIADVMVSGGAEAVICPMGVGGFNAMKAMSTRNDAPEKASRPFDKERDGFVMGEGAGTLILESLEHAQARGAKIYAELAGFGATADAHHITQPAPGGEGAVRSMRMSLADAGISESEIDYINVHGTSTPQGDISETEAIKTVFGDHARKVAISSTKSMTGHLLGAAGAVEAIATVLAIHNQVAPPTINLEFPDPECDLDYVPNVARPMQIRAAMSNGFGFGGHNATLVFKKFEA